MALKTTVLLILGVALVPLLTGCVTQRTVTENGRMVEQGTVFHRPIKKTVQRSR